MSEESQNDATASDQKPITASTTTGPVRLGLGRGIPRSEMNKAEPPSPSITQKNNDGNSSAFGSSNRFRNDDSANGETQYRNTSGGFGSQSRTNNFMRQEMQTGNNREFNSGPSGNPRLCYNCQKPGHMSRDCPEPKRPRDNISGRNHENYGQGGFKSGGTREGFNRSNTSEPNRNANDNRTFPNGNTSTSGGFRTVKDQGAESYGNDSTEPHRRNVFTNSAYRHSERSQDVQDNRDGGFRSNQRQSDRGNECFSCGQPGHKKYECPNNNGASNTGDFSSGRTSDRNFHQQENASASKPPARPCAPAPIPTTEQEIFGEAVSKGENFQKYHKTEVKCTPENRVTPIDLYDEAGLGTQIMSNIRSAHFEEPTAVQRYVIPCIQQQDDLMVCAQTGSGKTAAFLLPIISNLLQCHEAELFTKHDPPAPLCLILSPTRELALQTEKEARKFAYRTPVKSCSAVGGYDKHAVSNRLKDGCHILSATTGRLKDMVESGEISLKHVKYFVLDEADRMLDIGFEPDIRKLEDLGIPHKDDRFTSMFSATFPKAVQQLAARFLRDNYIFLAVGTIGGANEDITQVVEEVPASQKKHRLFELLEQKLKQERCLIFVETKKSADYIGALLSQKDFISTTMHGDRQQYQRAEAVKDFTSGKCPILVATSVAARGLDFPLIGYVINYDLPDTSDFYVHRIGRTGRAGHLGKSISFFDPDRQSDQQLAPELVQKLIEAGQDVPDFLKQFENNQTTGFHNAGRIGRNTDMRSEHNRFGGRRQYHGSGGGSTASGQASETWDEQ